MQGADINMHAGPLYYAAQRAVILLGCSCLALVTLLECYLSLNKHSPHFFSLLLKCLITDHIHRSQFEKETESQMTRPIAERKQDDNTKLSVR